VDFSPVFNKVVSEFKSNQVKLEKSGMTTLKIKEKLTKVNKDFVWFDMASKSKSDKFIPVLILRSSDRILATMDEVTKIYASIDSK